jgi:hypothetical protein
MIVMRDLSAWRLWAVSAVCTVALAALVGTTARAQTADEIIAKTITAQGGADVLKGLKSVERKGEVKVDGTFGQMEGSVQEVIVPWKKAVRALDLAVFVQKDGWDGKTAWRDGMMGLQEVEGEEADQIKLAASLNPFVQMAEGTKTEKLDDEKVEDVDYYVVQLAAPEKPPVKLYVEKESGQIRRTTLTRNHPQFGEVEIAVETNGYEKFGPVTLPTKSKMTLGDVLQIETTFTETKVDGDVDAKMFEMPKPAEDAPKDDAKKDEKKEEKKDDK